MKKIILILTAALVLTAACDSDGERTTWEKYSDWRELNNAWLEDMRTLTNEDGSPVYTVVRPDWNPEAMVLMRFINDPTENAGKLSPIYTSTIDVRYELHLCDSTAVDSSTNLTAYGTPGVFRSQLSALVQGWAVALPKMHCGDTAEIIIPYGLAYGTTSNGNIKPYSNLRFNVRLVDIPYYEAPPYK